jgi:hypothetical protein
MARHSPAPSSWRTVQSGVQASGSAEGRAERLATWVIVYLAALMTSLALVGGAWALGLVP